MSTAHGRGAGPLALLLCALMLTAGLGSCRDAPRDALRFGLAAAPVNLDPRYATDAASERINRLLYRHLVDFDAASRPTPDLASWQALGPTRYRLRLGTGGRTYHDGSRLTAADVKATYDSILDPASASPHRSALAVIARIEVVDVDTVDFHLSQPDLLFPGRLAIGILPGRLIAARHAFDHQPVGSGPLAFVNWPDEARLNLKRVADGQALQFVTVPDPTVRVLKLLRGEIDMLQNDLPPELVSYLSYRPDVQVIKGPGGNLSYLGFNLDDPVVGLRKVREAIAHAVDREAIIRYIFAGAARSASSVLPPEHWAGTADLPGYRYDPDRARELLRQAGFDPRHPAHIVYKTSSDPFRIRLATILQQQLAAVGLDVELRSYDWGTFYADIKAGRFQVYSLSWVGIRSPDIFRYAFHSTSVPPQGANRGRFVSVLADRLVEQAADADDLDAQAQIYRRLQRHLAEQLPYLGLWYEDQVFIARRDIQGYDVNIDGNYDALAAVKRVAARGVMPKR